MPNNLYLCGFMGTGKTTVGKLLADTLGEIFLDTDELIEQACGMSIPQIFSRYGEPYFRDQEFHALGYTEQFEQAIISTGGGMISQSDHVKYIKKLGRLIYLNTPFDLCYQRIQADSSRPHAFEQTQQYLLDLYDLREPIYLAAADLVIHCGDHPLDTVNAIINKI